jgi:uncharacterized protein
MIKTLLILTLAVGMIAGLSSCGCSSHHEKPRTIEVTGSAESDVVPDQIQLLLQIEEYWKEEYQKGKDYNDYKTRVPIDEIQARLVAKLKELGIPAKKIKLDDVSSSWRWYGKETLVTKQISITLDNFSQIDKIIKGIDMKGVSNIRIGEKKNSKIKELRKEIKLEALKVAREKAEFLLKGMDAEIGELVNVTEIANDANNNWYNYYYGYYGAAQSNVSNNEIPNETSLSSGQDIGSATIKLRYEMKAVFEIVD